MCIKRAVFGKPFPSAPCRHPLRGQRKHPDFRSSGSHLYAAIYIRRGPVAQRQLSQMQASYNATPANDNCEACKGVALSRSDSLSNPGLRQKQLRQTTNIEACKETFCPVPAPSFPFVPYLIGLCQNSRLLLFWEERLPHHRTQVPSEPKMQTAARFHPSGTGPVGKRQHGKSGLRAGLPPQRQFVNDEHRKSAVPKEQVTAHKREQSLRQTVRFETRKDDFPCSVFPQSDKIFHVHGVWHGFCIF